MKQFLKVLLLVVLALIALKFLPLTFGLGCVLAVALIVLAALGVSIMAAATVVVLVLAALAAPIWIPVLLLFGLIAIIRKANRRAAGT